MRLLEQFYYWVGLNERYSSASESKIAEDLGRMDLIAKGKSPNYPATELSVDPREIEETRFSVGNAYCKAILCVLAYQQPKSFDTSGVVILDNSNLKIASSRNYHHFFPKDYLKRNQKESEPNLIANITLIDGYSNKHGIGAKAPKEYMAKFAKDNARLPSALKTHLINDLQSFGVKTNNYNRFIERRSEAISAALNIKLMSGTGTPTDK